MLGSQLLSVEQLLDSMLGNQLLSVEQLLEQLNAREPAAKCGAAPCAAQC